MKSLALAYTVIANIPQISPKKTLAPAVATCSGRGMPGIKHIHIPLTMGPMGTRALVHHDFPERVGIAPSRPVRTM